MGVLGQGSLCYAAVAGGVGVGNTNTPKSIPQSPRLHKLRVPGGPWSTPGSPRDPWAPHRMDAYEIRSSTGAVRLQSTNGAPGLHTAARVTVGGQPQPKAPPRGRKGGPSHRASDTRPRRLGRDWWHLITVGLKSSQEPKSLAAARWGSQHPYGPARGNGNTPAQQRGLEQGESSLSLIPTLRAHKPLKPTWYFACTGAILPAKAGMR